MIRDIEAARAYALTAGVHEGEIGNLARCFLGADNDRRALRTMLEMVALELRTVAPHTAGELMHYLAKFPR